uniref:KIB1-4 beta-propeller domain-containing protein n=1 Tax=Brassica campestris TaxID=3711 RepID=M4C957_BRACM
MAPRKTTSNMVWVFSKLQLSSKEHTLSLSDWSLLPEELLHIISAKLEDCFDFIHARSVCRPWRPVFPFPPSLLRTRYSLPSFDKFPRKGRGFCTLEKFPLFLFRVRSPDSLLPSEFFVGGIRPENHVEFPPSVQCSVKMKMTPDSPPTLLNIADCQIIPLGYKWRMVGHDPNSLATRYRGAAFLPLNKEKGEFIVLIGYSRHILVLRSTEMRWTRLQNSSEADCRDIVAFRGKFYAVFINGDVFAIDPYTLETTPLIPPEIVDCGRCNNLVPYGDDELYLVERIIVRNGVLCFSKLACRVSVLDEEAGEWVVVSDLGDRVLLIGQPGNCSGNGSCSAKDLPEGCGVSGSSMLFINEIFDVTYPYKYGVDTGNPEDGLNVWRCSRETRVTILNKSPMVAMRLEHAEPNLLQHKPHNNPIQQEENKRNKKQDRNRLSRWPCTREVELKKRWLDIGRSSDGKEAVGHEPGNSIAVRTMCAEEDLEAKNPHFPFLPYHVYGGLEDELYNAPGLRWKHS